MKCILQELRRLSMLCQVAKLWSNPLAKKHYRYMLGQGGKRAGSLLFWWHDEKASRSMMFSRHECGGSQRKTKWLFWGRRSLQCVPCSRELQLHRCHINSICQAVGADKNTNDCQKQALRLLPFFLFLFSCYARVIAAVYRKHGIKLSFTLS